jgi:hypothetical protein
MQTKVYRTLSLLALALILVLSSTVGAVAVEKEEEKYENGALTPPPEPEMSLMGLFNGHTYLWYGTNIFQILSSGTVRATAETRAYQFVDIIGATVYIQQWTGSSWITVGSGTPMYFFDEDYFLGAQTFSGLSAGYYYRLRTVHWVDHNGVYEQDVVFSDYLLMY